MQLRQRIIDAIGDDALTLDDLADRVGEPAPQINKLLQLAPSFTKIDGRIVYLPALLDGTTWVVPIDADDAASDRAPGGFVRMRPYLTAIGWWLIDSDTEAYDADGERLGTISTDGMMIDDVDTDVIMCAPGWLDAVAGGWAAITVHDDELTIAPTDGPPEPTPAQIEAFTRGFEQSIEAEKGSTFGGEEHTFDIASSSTVFHAALLADRDVFRTDPVPPVDRLVEAAGLQCDDDMVVARGFDWDAYRSWQRRNRLRLYHGIDDRQVDLVQMLVGACELHAEEGDAAFGAPEEWASVGVLLAGALDDVDVAAAFTGETRRRGISFEVLLAFAEALDRHARSGGSDRNEGVVAVQVRAHSLLGNEPRAAELLDATVDTGTRHPHLLHLAAELAADRGRAADARQLVARTGATPYDPAADDRRHPWQGGPTDAQLLLAEVEPYARPRAGRDVGRNSPCPCGSGKKYKACHLGKEEVSLADRAPWLYEKHIRYVRTRTPVLLDDVAEHIAGDSLQLYYELLDTPIVVDLVLHELEVDQDFLEGRGPFLPDDEQLLAAQWALVDRGVYEVEDVRRRPDGGELRLRDLGSGEVVVVSQVHVGDQIRPGMLLLGRPLPVGDTYRAFSGFWPLDPSPTNAAIEAVAAADVEVLCDLMGARLRPPTISNTDGEVMEWHRITWSVPPDPESVAAVLAASGLRGPDPGSTPDGSRWHLVRDTANQPDTIIAVIDVRPGEDGTEVVVEVNSEERAEELDELVEGWFPDAELIDDEILDLDKVQPPGELPELDDPAVREVLEARMAKYEEQWLDEHVPALQGRTPREAVQDPIGREEVLRLLASFPEPAPGTVGMSPTRLRNALGL